jgi:hypothetical protein
MARVAAISRTVRWPSGLFNSSLEGNTRRAIDFHEDDRIDEKALTPIIRAAVAPNTSVRTTARPCGPLPALLVSVRKCPPTGRKNA